MLDEIIVGGMVLETNIHSILDAVVSHTRGNTTLFWKPVLKRSNGKCVYMFFFIQPGMKVIGVMLINSSSPGFVPYVVIGMDGCIYLKKKFDCLLSFDVRMFEQALRLSVCKLTVFLVFRYGKTACIQNH